MENRVSTDESAASKKKRRKQLQVRKWLEERIDKEMYQQLLPPSCRSNEHLRAFFNKLYDLEESVYPQFYKGYKRFFASYMMTYLYEKNISDVQLISTVILSFLEHTEDFSGAIIQFQQNDFETFAEITKRIPQNNYLKWPDQISNEVLYTAVELSQYSVINFFVKYGMCSFAAPCIPQTSTLKYFIRYADDIQKQKLVGKVRMNRKKLYLTAFAIDAAFCCKEATTPADVARCMRKARCIDLLARTTAEPLIVLADVEEFCRFYFEGTQQQRQNVPNFRSIPENVKPHLLKLFPDISEYHQVRSLCDLSRCSIRECLRSDRVLPHQVAGLPLPDILKNFILFHESDFAQSMWDDVTNKYF